MRAMCLVVACWLIAGRARAQEEPASGELEAPIVTLASPSCSDLPFDWDAFASLLALELAEDEIVTRTDDVDGVAHLRVLTSCADADIPIDVARVELEDRITQKLVTRDFDLTEVPMRSRSRALALGAAELLRASWAELAMASVPPPSVEIPARVREAVRVVPRRPLSDPAPPLQAAPEHEALELLTLRGGVEVWAFPSGNLAIAAFFVESDVSLLENVHLRLGASGGYGQSSHPLGEVDVAQLLGREGVSLGARLPGIRLSVTPTLDIGWGGTWGRTSRADVVVGNGGAFLVLAHLDLDFAMAISHAVDLHGAVGAGYALLGVRAVALGSAFSGISGASIQVAVGVAVRIE